jgi:hypothetical protein
MHEPKNLNYLTLDAPLGSGAQAEEVYKIAEVGAVNNELCDLGVQPPKVRADTPLSSDVQAGT